MDARMETLLKVYETRNFTRAAKELSLTQPAVSQHIKQLEHDLDAALFIRGEKGLKPTPEGEIVVKYARRIQTLYPEYGAEFGGREAQCHPSVRRDHPLLREQRHRRGPGRLYPHNPRQPYYHSF